MTEEQRERNRQYQREYYQSHRREIIEKVAEWRKRNPEKAKEHSKKYFQKYYATNKDLINRRRREQRQRKRVEVIRCKDCKYMYEDNQYMCGARGFCVDENFFCADGERR